jgi:hypothetical protein
MSKATTYNWGGRLMTICSAVVLAFSPSILPKGILWLIIIVAGVGFVVGVVLWIYGCKYAVKERSAKSVVIREQNRDIDDILNTVEAMDNRLYALLPEIERKPLTKLRAEKIFNTSNALYIFVTIYFPIVKPQELISTLMDDNNIGVASVLKEKIYQELNQKLEKQMRLRNINFRNAVYKHIRFWHTAYNCMLYLRRYKVFKKGRMGLLNSYALRKLESTHAQGVGNMLVSLALRLAKEDKNG